MKSTYTVAYRRRREGKTDYLLRRKMIASHKPRVVVRKSLNHISMQIIKYSAQGDTVLASAHTKELTTYGWKSHAGNTPAAYLVGRLLGIRAKKSGITTAVADIGIQTSVKGGVLYAALKGIQDEGVQLGVAQEVIPDQKRIMGEHIAEWATILKKQNPEKYQRVFQDYIRNNLSPEQLPTMVQTVLRAIGGKA